MTVFALDDQPIPLRKEQRGLAESINRLLGTSPAVWYRDACRLVGPPIDGRLESVAFLVPMLLGQIEQKLRAVLLPAEFVPLVNLDPRVQEIEEITATNELAGPARERWLRCLEQIDQTRTEAGESRARAPMLRALLDDCDILFASLLDILARSYVGVLERINKLPVKPDAKALRALLDRLPESAPVEDRLLEKLPRDGQYLEALRRAGFFRRPPAPIRDERGEVLSHPPWIALHYLADFTGTHPREVGPILLSIPPTENISVHSKMAEIAAKLPVPIAAEWALSEITWLKDPKEQRSDLSGHLSHLGVMLIEHGVVEVGKVLLQTLLIYPEPKPETEAGKREPLAIQESIVRSFLVQQSQRLTKANPLVALELLAEILQSLPKSETRFSVGPIDRPIRQDSRVWPDRLIQRLLIDAIRAAAEQLVANGALEATIAQIESHPGPLFRRLALHLLRRYPSGAEALIRKRLVDQLAFYSRELEPEYSLLLGEQMGRLTKPEQLRIQGWIQKGPPLAELDSFRDDELGRIERDRYIESWTYRNLRALEPSKELLLPALRTRYENLSRTYAPKPAPDPLRIKSADGILSLTADELKEFLLAWRPGEQEGLDNWSESQPDALRQAVASAPEQFTVKPRFLRDVHPLLQVAFLDGLQEAARSGRVTVTDQILLLMQDFLSKAYEPSSKIKASQKSWLPVHLSEARLLQTALVREDQPLLSLRDFNLLLDVLRVLLSLPPESLNPDYLTSTPGSRASEISQHLLNSPRGIAFDTLLWVYRWLYDDRQQESQGKTLHRPNSDIQGILNRLLEEMDPVIQGAFGQNISRLLYFEEQWTITNIRRIFPTRTENKQLFAAAWETYLLYGSGYPGDERFALLQFAYEHAVELLSEQRGYNGTVDANPPWKALAEHLAGIYLSNLIDLAPSGLLERFFARSPDSMCAALLRYAAELVNPRRLRRDGSESSDGALSEERERASSLWTFRAQTIFAEPKAHFLEAGAFAGYFINEAFDPTWALYQLERTLPFAVYEHYEVRRIQERLAALSSEYPVECMRCLDGYLKRTHYLINIVPEAVKSIFEQANKSSEPAAVRAAHDWLNQLVSSGIPIAALSSTVHPVPAPSSVALVDDNPSPESTSIRPAKRQGTAQINRLIVKGFKSLADLDLELGLFNVFIGANGSGKTNVLEALGVLGAAIGGEVESETLTARGVRATKPVLFKSSFASQDLHRLITLAAYGLDRTLYQLEIENPSESAESPWRVFSERLETEGRQTRILSRSVRDCLITDGHGNPRHIDNPKETATYAASAANDNPDASGAQETLEALTRYVIYSLNTQVLRGLAPDREKVPLGLSGGGLPGALRDVLTKDALGAFDLKDVLALLGWASEISVVPADQAVLSSAVHAGPLVVEFRDRYMRKGLDLLSGYDANEGVLYVLFYLVLACHPKAPRVCAIDDFDHCLNPLLAYRMTETIAQHFVSDGSRQWLVTTHNPLVLDGLDLSDDRIRLFAVDRDESGLTQVKRVVVDSELLTKHEEGYALSNLWVMGRLNGLPKNL